MQGGEVVVALLARVGAPLLVGLALESCLLLGLLLVGLVLLARVGAPFLVGLALEPCLLLERGLVGLALRLVGLALRLGEWAPPVQLGNRLDGVCERPVLLGELPDLGKLALQLRPQSDEFLTLRFERRWHLQLAQTQPVQLDLLGEVEG